MDKSFETKMRSALGARRMKLLGTDDELVNDAQGLRDNDDVDLEDHAQTAQAGEVIARLDQRDARELAELDAALGRLAEGSYGLCTSCDEEIPQARLEALPEARTCAPCAEEQGARRSAASL